MTGALDEDLGRAAVRALRLDPEACRNYALQYGWDVITREFESNLVPCNSAGAECLPVLGERSAGAPGSPAPRASLSRS